MYGKMITAREEARIKRLRASGMTQEAVGIACGVSAHSVARVVAGKRNGPHVTRQQNWEAMLRRKRK